VVVECLGAVGVAASPLKSLGEDGVSDSESAAHRLPRSGRVSPHWQPFRRSRRFRARLGSPPGDRDRQASQVRVPQRGAPWLHTTPFKFPLPLVPQRQPEWEACEDRGTRPSCCRRRRTAQTGAERPAIVLLACVAWYAYTACGCVARSDSDSSPRLGGSIGVSVKAGGAKAAGWPSSRGSTRLAVRSSRRESRDPRTPARDQNSTFVQK
jgi:hypothetical protein